MPLSENEETSDRTNPTTKCTSDSSMDPATRTQKLPRKREGERKREREAGERDRHRDQLNGPPSPLANVSQDGSWH